MGEKVLGRMSLLGIITASRVGNVAGRCRGSEWETNWGLVRVRGELGENGDEEVWDMSSGSGKQHLLS